MKPSPGDAGREAQGHHLSSIPQPRVPLQTALPWMRYVSVACVVGIIAGFCMGPGGSGVSGSGGWGVGMGVLGEQWGLQGGGRTGALSPSLWPDPGLSCCTP